MNKEDLIKLLKSEPLKFTYEEIEQMMDEELSKAPAEMDTDFVDLCADVLCNALSSGIVTNEAEIKKHRKLKLAKIASIAAVIVIILNIAVPVSAKYIKNDTSDKIVQFYEDHFSINLANGETSAEKHSDTDSDLINELKNSGFDNIILPTALLNGDYTYDVDFDENEETLTAFISLNNIDVNILITQYENDVNQILTNDTQITEEYDSAKQLSINGIDVLVLGNNDKSSIIYIDVNTYYNIVLNNYNFDSAVEIAQSIK